MLSSVIGLAVDVVGAVVLTLVLLEGKDPRRWGEINNRTEIRPPERVARERSYESGLLLLSSGFFLQALPSFGARAGCRRGELWSLPCLGSA